MGSQRHRPRKTPAVAAGRLISPCPHYFCQSRFQFCLSLPLVPRPDQMRLVNAETNTKTAIGDPPCGKNPFTAFLSARSV